MTRYVWLDFNTGKFSRSWTEEDWPEEKFTQNDFELAKEHNMKLIKYECLSHKDFQFSDTMKIN